MSRQLHCAALLAAVLGAATAHGPALAQLSLPPDLQKQRVPITRPEPPPPTPEPAAPKAAGPRSAAPKQLAAPKLPAKPQPLDPNADNAYAAYQEGRYRTALDLALARANERNDPKSMTLGGELYANGLGIARDDAKAAEWYKKAVDLGDREAMFALAMMQIAGRAGPANREEGARLLAQSAKLGKAAAAYNLGLLYLEGQTFPQDIKRAAELFTQAAKAGNPEAQYALATFYKEGRGVEKNPVEAAKLLGAAALADNIDAEVEYAIALLNGTGVTRDIPTAVALMSRAARQNSPIAQNRLAHILIEGQGVPANPVEGFKWHIIAKTAGAGDPDLDARMAQLSAEDRQKAEDGAKRWFGLIK